MPGDDADNDRAIAASIPDLSLRRRALLKTAGAGVVGSTALSGTAAASSVYNGPVSRTYNAATVDPSAINTLPEGGDSPDSEGEGEEVNRTIPKKPPEASGTARGGGGPAQTSASEGGLVEMDFEGLSALDVRGVVPSDAQIAAGPDNLVQAINSQVAFFDTNGNQNFQASLDAFFTNATPLISDKNPGDGFFKHYLTFAR